MCPSHTCLTPATSHPQPTRAQPWKLCCQGTGLGGTPTRTCPKARAQTLETEPLCLSRLGAPRASTSFRLFCTYFPLSLWAGPLICVHTLGLGSAARWQMCFGTQDGVYLHLSLRRVFWSAVAVPDNMGACPGQRCPLRPLPRADLHCQDYRAVCERAPVSLWPAQVLCSAPSAPLSEVAASGSFHLAPPPPPAHPPHFLISLTKNTLTSKCFSFLGCIRPVKCGWGPPVSSWGNHKDQKGKRF